MRTSIRDEIVEVRTWRSGVEIVSRINWTHVARVRRSLELTGDSFTDSPFAVPSPRLRVISVAASVWRRGRRAA